MAPPVATIGLSNITMTTQRQTMLPDLSTSMLSMYSEYDNYDYNDVSASSRHRDHNNVGDGRDFEGEDNDNDVMLVDNENGSTGRQSWLPQIIIPGPFVVLQGCAGDGMANTINTSPTLPPSERNVRRQIGNSSNQNTNESMTSERFVSVGSDDAAIITQEEAVVEDVASSSFHHVTRPQPPASRHLASSTTINPYAGRGAMNTAVITPASSFNTDSDPLENEQEDIDIYNNATSWHSVLSPAEVETIAKWREDCMDEETRQYLVWKRSLHQESSSRLMDHAMVTLDDAGNTNCRWWQPDYNHQLAILRDIPTKLHNGNVLRTVIGSLPPGTTLIARDIVHLDSSTLQRLPVLPLRRMENDCNDETGRMAATPRRVYARGQKGVIQLLQVETPEGRTGYAVSCLDGYSLLAPGLPQHYVDPQLWMWRVTCPAGAFVREGLDLCTQHRDTIPFGSLIHVTRRSINNQGLSRLKTHWIIPDSSLEIDHEPQRTQRMAAPTLTPENNDMGERHVDGYCSELLNPLSGQRGVVVQPLPFPVPANYRVILPDGAVIRQDVELSSPQLGVIPCGSEVKVVARAFSEHPMDKCVERLQLAGNAGWISMRLNRMPPHDDMVVELVDVDSYFDPENPGLYHLQAQKAIRSHLQETNAMQLSEVDLSSVDENDVSDDNSDDDMDGPSQVQSHRQNNTPSSTAEESRCVVCLASERNATIVHGSTGHVVCCLVCARILKARGDSCPICRLKIDLVIQHFHA